MHDARRSHPLAANSDSPLPAARDGRIFAIGEKYDRLADGFSERDYADPHLYAAHRARLVVELKPTLLAGETVLDLGCGDGIMAGPLRARGLHYRGVDVSPGMIRTARSRHPDLPFEVARAEEYTPPEPVDATICLRAFFYPEDRVGFFRRIHSYTRAKFVFDFRRSQHDLEVLVRDLGEAGFRDIEFKPFLLPQKRRLPSPLVPVVLGLERASAVATLLSRRHGRMFCAARV